MKVTLITIATLAVISVAYAEIGNDKLSLAKIVGALCMPGGHSDASAAAFYACYNEVPAQKERFDFCQIQSFKTVLDTKAHVHEACWFPWRLASYAKCLKEQFEGAEAELDVAVTAVNKCQAKAVGVE